MNRFVERLSEKELQDEIDKTLSPKSISKAKWAVSVFKEWLRHRNSQGIVEGLHVFKTFEEMTKSELDHQLSYFLFETRKKDGSKYPSTSIRDLYQGIGYYIVNILKRDWRVFTDQEFMRARQSLNAAMIAVNKENVQAQGGGPSAPISENSEAILWSSGVLGDETPKQLVRTVFFMIGKFFALRGGAEHRNLVWNRDIQLVQTEFGEALQYTNQFAKNRRGGLNDRHVKPKTVKIFANKENPQRCLLRIFKKYSEKRENIKSEAYYLKPLEKYGQLWYQNMALGHNSLSNMMKSICEQAGLEGRYTNHSLKKTTATCLRHMSEVQRRSHTGNRSSSLSCYETMTDKDFTETSNVLYNNDAQAENSSLTAQVSITTENNIEIHSAPSKKLKIEVDGQQNKIKFTFE